MKPFYAFVIFIFKWSTRLLYRHRVYGLKEIPKGAAIIAPNHASHLDPILVAISWPEEIHFLGRRTLFDHPRLGKIISRLNCHPVNREGADPSSLKMIVSLLREGDKVMIFPEGSRSTDGNLQEGQLGVAMLAMRANCPIIPVYVHGAYDAWPKGRPRPKLFGKTACIFGEPIQMANYATLPKKEAQRLITERLMQSLADLKEKGVRPR